MKPKKISLFASGSGTNVQNIVHYFSSQKPVQVNGIFCNNPDAYVIERAKKLKISSYIFNRTQFYETREVLDTLVKLQTDLIVLAGFLWLVPNPVLQHFPGRIVNIHPALLPKYGGKGMYGMRVHEAVVANKEKETGITVHYVNEEYDKGDIIFQAKIPVLPEDTPEEVAQKVHQLEYLHYPKQIQRVLESL